MMENPIKIIQQQIARGQLEEALAACQTSKNPEDPNPELFYMAAVCCRLMKQFDEAMHELAELKRLVPEHSRAYQEEGHLYRDRGQMELALQSYARACQYNPALLASWKGQFDILTAIGRSEQARFVERRLAYFQSQPKPLLAVLELVSQGRLLKAEQFCREFLKQVPSNVEGMRLLADIGVRLGVLDDAEFLLASALKFDSNNELVRMDYVQTLRKKQKFTEALEQARLLLKQDPNNLQFQSLCAIEYMQSGDYSKALEMFDGVLERVPADPLTLTSKGHALKTVGEYDDAVTSYQAALRSQPRHGEAWYSLANLKTYRFSDEEMAEMERLRGQEGFGPMDLVYLSFALGKAYEDRGDFEPSFQRYAEGNALKKAQSRYSSEQMHDEFAAQMTVCSSDLLEKRFEAACPHDDPIFVVGLPRAGSTLIEQILASHSRVDGTLELPNILSLAHKLRRGEVISAEAQYPSVLESLSPSQLKEMGEQYIEETRVHRKDAPFFVDKMPNNFRHIGLIKLILPNAKIIDARRHPMSCCFSGFKQLFAEGQEFSYSLEDIGRYYRDYVELMKHWDEVLPGEVLRVQHEDVIEDLEGQVRRLLDFCGLPFEYGCVEYYKTERNVRTPSSEQVRQPIFRDSMEAWQNFEAWLDPLKQALGPELL